MLRILRNLESKGRSFHSLKSGMIHRPLDLNADLLHFSASGNSTNSYLVNYRDLNTLSHNVKEVPGLHSLIGERCQWSSKLTFATSCNEQHTNVQEKYATVGDYRLGYTQVGQGPHVLLLLPGALGSGRGDFGPQLSGLDTSLFTLVAWDPPGYGASRPPDRSWPSDFFRRDADCAAGLMKTLGFDQYSILGWSDGGITSLIMAAKHPQAVRRMIVFGANAYVSEEDLKMYENVRDVSNWSARMREPLELVYGEQGFPKLWGEWLDAIARYYTEKQGDICKSEVRDIRCPALVVHGCKDAMVPQFHPDFLREHIDNARYYEFADGKHNLHFKYAEEFNRVVTEFLSE